jgi:hypothetical protein
LSTLLIDNINKLYNNSATSNNTSGAHYLLSPDRSDPIPKDHQIDKEVPGHVHQQH